MSTSTDNRLYRRHVARANGEDVIDAAYRAGREGRVWSGPSREVSSSVRDQAEEAYAQGDQERRSSERQERRSRAVRPLTREARRASRGTVGSLTHVLVLSLGLVALYVVLRAGSLASSLLSPIESALRWLMSPTATIGGKSS